MADPGDAERVVGPLAELAGALADAYRALDEARRAEFDRSLPFADAVLGDRWDRAARLGFAAGASIYNSALVLGDVRVGEQTWIGPNVVLDGSGGTLSVGAWCSVSTGVHLYTHDTVAWSLSGGAVERFVAPTTIGDRCHLGAAAVVAAGAEIGAGCVVGAQSFVKGVVPDGLVVAGSPARPIGIVTGSGAEVEVRTDPDARLAAEQRWTAARAGGDA